MKVWLIVLLSLSNLLLLTKVYGQQSRLNYPSLNTKPLQVGYVIDVYLEQVKIKSQFPKKHVSSEDIKDHPYSEEDYYNWVDEHYVAKKDIVLLVGFGDRKEYMRLLGCKLPDLMNKRIGYETLHFIKSRIAHKFIRFCHDVTQRDEERRLLAYVYYGKNNFLLNAKLLEYGYCHFDTTYPCQMQSQFLALTNYKRVIDTYIEFIVKMDWLIYNGKTAAAGKLFQVEEIEPNAEQNFFQLIHSSPVLYREYYQKLETRRRQLGLVYP